MPRVIVTEPVHEDALALLRDAGWTVEGPGAALMPAEALLVQMKAEEAATTQSPPLAAPVLETTAETPATAEAH